MEKKYKNLVKNTGILTIGIFGSKILSFFIVPFYTYVLTTEEYGQIDIFTTSISLMVPFVTMQIQEAMIRFIASREMDEKKVLNNCLAVYVFGMILVFLFIPVYHLFLPNKRYVITYVVYLVLNSFYSIFSHYLRLVEKNVAYSINGIIITLVTVVSNVILLVFLKAGVYGYIYSLIIAQLISVIFIVWIGRIPEKISIREIDKEILRELLTYSIPLIPNGLMWWIMNAGDKYIINYYIGDSGNGIYSLAIKIPTMISMFYSIFTTAWQISAIEELNMEQVGEYYSNVFKSISMILIMIVCVIIPFVKPIFLIMNKDFFEAWEYVPLLSIAMILSCYASFVGVVYNVYKKSKKIFMTTFIGAVVNIISNFLLVKSIGLYGIAIGTALGYLIVFLVRAKDAKQCTGMLLDCPRILAGFIILLIENISVLLLEWWSGIVVCGGCFILLLIVYKKEYKIFYSMIKNKISKIKGA